MRKVSLIVIALVCSLLCTAQEINCKVTVNSDKIEGTNKEVFNALQKSVEDYISLQDLGAELFDHPLDREILVDGDYYHDPSIPEDEMTWQYAVVPAGFPFPRQLIPHPLQFLLPG